MVTSIRSLQSPPKLSGLCSTTFCNVFPVFTNPKLMSNHCHPACRRDASPPSAPRLFARLGLPAAGAFRYPLAATCHTMKVPFFALLVAVTIFNNVGCGKKPQPGYHLYARFSTVQTLRVGDPVIMAGLQIGHVQSIVLDPTGGGTVVRMEIKRSVVVKTDSTATINSTPSPGRSSIVLDGGSPDAPAALEGVILKTREKPSSENQMHPHALSPKFGRANRRSASPPGAERQIGCTFHTPTRPPAVVAGHSK